jgi:dephospho-CoA kinase
VSAEFGVLRKRGGRGLEAFGGVVYTAVMGTWKHNRAKPVIGLSGGIGSGKSTVGRLFGELGCAVFNADALAHEVIEEPEVRAELRAWLGAGVFNPDGSVNRKVVGGRVFSDEGARRRLNGLIHPRVLLRRDVLMREAMAEPLVKAIVWDTPLLFETGLEGECDVLVFVKALPELRLRRVQASRGWDAAELARREKMQLPLDKKREKADYCIENSGEVNASLSQVQRVLSQILDRQP